MVSFWAAHLMWLWLLIFVLCLLVESLTVSLTTLWAALAALPFIFISRMGLPLRWQFLGWVVLTLALLVFTRPFALKQLKLHSAKNNTNVNSMLGQTVVITKDISEFERGLAKSKNGVVWSASCSPAFLQDGQQKTIGTGIICKVCAVQGNCLVVEPCETQKSEGNTSDTKES